MNMNDIANLIKQSDLNDQEIKNLLDAWRNDNRINEDKR